MPGRIIQMEKLERSQFRKIYCKCPAKSNVNSNDNKCTSRSGKCTHIFLVLHSINWMV
ncbi:uncharacterized protein Smp_200350 [Schistosoma mansoni]|uniref:uncharacterized protein n=1 Tax=Schistosoma mansoni TaxID=6183 RepID=UPI00022DC8F1|nr:uncharacterized protein Smp_200350 [Schistosoma mansoni]|eukprot:XP_018647785.1 uncharacterized protein Smp_200350 [Schistosoma mansoni]